MKLKGHYILDVYSAYKDKLDPIDMLTFYEVVNSLCDNEREVLHYRYWQGETLEELGRDLDLTRESIRQRERKALRNLRRPKKARYLKRMLGY